MSIDVKDIFCEPFGKCVLISNSVIEVCVTVDKGPRIIHFGFINEEGLLFNKSIIDIIPISQLDNTAKNTQSLDEYSGHRLLLKEYPSKSNIPLIEDEPIVYSILPEGIRFVPPYENLQTSIEITLSENTNNLMILHSVKNLSYEKKNLAICASTSFLGKNGILVVPQNEEYSDIAPNRIISLWSYSKINDSRLSLFDKYLTFSPNSKNKSSFRLGTNNTPGWVAFLCNNTAFFKRFVHNSNAKYLDGESSLEFFSTENVLTVETLSPIFEIGKNEIARHAENWSIFKAGMQYQFNSAKEIDKFLNDIE